MISILERSPLRVIVDGFTMISAALLWLSPRIIISITMPLVIAETLRIPGARCVLSDEMPAVSLMKLVMLSGTMALLPLRLPEVMGLAVESG